MIICIQSKKIKGLSITKIIKFIRGFVKPTALTTSIIFTPFNQKLLCTLHFSLPSTILVVSIMVTNTFIIEDNKRIFLKKIVDHCTKYEVFH